MKAEKIINRMWVRISRTTNLPPPSSETRKYPYPPKNKLSSSHLKINSKLTGWSSTHLRCLHGWGNMCPLHNASGIMDGKLVPAKLDEMYDRCSFINSFVGFPGIGN